MRSIRRLLATSVVAVSAFAVVPAVSEAAACTGADTAGSSKDGVRATLCLLNAERRAAGLRPLRMDTKLGRAAERPRPRHGRPAATSITTPRPAPPSAPASSAPAGPSRAAPRPIGENIGWGGGDARDPARHGPRLDAQLRPPRQHPLPPVPHDRHRHRQRRPHRRRRRDLRHRLRRLSFLKRDCPPLGLGCVARGEASSSAPGRGSRRRCRGAGDPVLAASRGASPAGGPACLGGRGARWRRSRSTWSSSTATRPGWTRPRCAACCARTSGSATRGCWRSPSPPRAGWPTRCSTRAPTTTCTGRSPARS